MLRLINQYDVTIKHWDWVFNRRNINKIAYDYDSEVLKFEPEIKSATIKDSQGRLLWIAETAPDYTAIIQRKKRQLETKTEARKDQLKQYY